MRLSSHFSNESPVKKEIDTKPKQMTNRPETSGGRTPVQKQGWMDASDASPSHNDRSMHTAVSHHSPPDIIQPTNRGRSLRSAALEKSSPHISHEKHDDIVRWSQVSAPLIIR